MQVDFLWAESAHVLPALRWARWRKSREFSRRNRVVPRTLVYRLPSGTALAKAAGRATGARTHTAHAERLERPGAGPLRNQDRRRHEGAAGGCIAAMKERADMRELMARLVREDEGQDLVEYVLLISLIGLALVASFGTVRDAIGAVFTRVQSTLGGGGGGG
jgi:Flp pilus assembly pilin Flp